MLAKSGMAFKDIYAIMCSCGDDYAYERLLDYEIDAVSYESHDAEIRVFAAYIRHICPDSDGGYIGIDLANSPDFLVAFWGVLMSGHKPYLINSFYPSALKIKLLHKLGVELVISEETCYADFTVIHTNAYAKDCPKITDGHWQNEFALSSTMTGLEAKICVFGGEAVAHQILNTLGVLKTNKRLIKGYQKRIKIVMLLPLFHIFGIMVSYFWCAFFGGTPVFLQDTSPDAIRRAINRHKVTHIFAPPVFFHRLHKGIMAGISQGGEELKVKFQKGVRLAYSLQNIFPSLGLLISRRLFRDALSLSLGLSPQIMISGGAHIDGETLKVINCIGYPLFNGYGTTETGITGVNLAKRIRLRTNGSIGDPFASVDYTYGKDGTLVVSGASICKKIITFQDEQSGFSGIETKDIAQSINGRHFIVGRKSDLFIGANGENISPDTIQNELTVKNAKRYCVLEIGNKLAILLEYDTKLPSAIIANDIDNIKKTLASISYGQQINDIFVTRDPIANPNAIKESRELLRRKIADGSIVLTDYKELLRESNNPKDSADDTTMQTIKQTFQNAANTGAAVQSDADFFIDLGGTSLDYLAMVSELESIFNVQFNLEKNQNLRTPESFYKHIMDILL